MLRSKTFINILMLLCILDLAASCKKKEEEETPATPEIPPVGTLSLGTESLGVDDSTEASLFSAGAEGGNYSEAKFAVGLVGLLVGVQVAIPAASIRYALAQTASYLGDYTWSWSFSFFNSSVTYKAELTGKYTPEINSTAWTMSITRDPKDTNGCCENFAWLTGESKGITEGTWHINDAENQTISARRTLEWTYNSELDRSTYFYVNNPTDEEISNGWAEGGYVSFVRSGTKATLTVKKDSTDADEAYVTWNTDTKAGSYHKENGTNICWDADLQDIDCTTTY